jgi:DNA modification methylase
MKLDAQILHGDVIEKLRSLPDNSVHCVVTSPPYWNLRDYKDADGKSVSGQIGLEPTLEEYLDKIVMVFEEVRRVLRSDGTCWVNLGDCYAGGGNGGGGSFAKDSVHGADEVGGGTGKNVPGRKGSRGVTPKRKLTTEGTESTEENTESKGKRIPRGSGRWGGGNAASSELKRKDLAGMPWRVALALQAAGWYLRCDVIWNKPNPMPESVYDRPTRSHEYVFLLTKSERYFYDHEAVKEPVTGGAHARISESEAEIRSAKNAYRPKGWARTNAERKDKSGRYSDSTEEREGREGLDKQSRMGRRHAGFNDRWKAKHGLNGSSKDQQRDLPGGEFVRPSLFGDAEEIDPQIAQRDADLKPKKVSRSSRFVTDRVPSKAARADGGVKANRSFSAAVVGLVSKRSRRSVWTIPTYSYRGEHFATFPPKLVEPCVLAGTSEGGCCSVCGAPRLRIVVDGEFFEEWQKRCGGDRNGEYHGQSQKDYAGAKAQNASETKARILAGMVEKKTIGWRWGCKKNIECIKGHRRAVPCVVMDPFNGTATVGEVALSHGRRYIGIDISAKYVALSNERLGNINLPLVMYEEVEEDLNLTTGASRTGSTESAEENTERNGK